MCIIRNENRQKKKKLFIHNIFGDFCDSFNFGIFGKIPETRLLDAHTISDFSWFSLSHAY